MASVSRSIPVIGVIGGIGSGKSVLTDALGKLLRVCSLDADAAGHDALELQSVKDRLRNVFGAEVFKESGEVSRIHLAKLVFGDTQPERQRRTQLEEIVHPEIRRTLEKQLKEFQDARTCDVILLDAALMLEAGWSTICDAIVFVKVPDAVRFERVQRRGWSREDFQRREASQYSLERKRASADFVIDNSGPIEVAAQAFAEWVKSQFLLPFSESISNQNLNTPV